MPAILEKIIQWLLPYLINYAQKHIPEVLDYVVKSAKDKYSEFMKEGHSMSTDETVANTTTTSTTEESTVVADTLTGIISSFVFSAPTSIDDAKAQYKALLANIESEKSVITSALSASSLTVLQTQAANLLYTVKKSFQAAMDYYVAERSKLNKFTGFFKWIEYTGMITGIYFARYNALKYITELETKIAALLTA